jgi:hypothetical protein
MGQHVRPTNTILPLNGAPRDALRRFTVAISTDVYSAMVQEQTARCAQGENTKTASFSKVIEDALIMYLGVGSEPEEMEERGQTT